MGIGTDQDTWLGKVQNLEPKETASAQIGDLVVRRIELAGLPEFELEMPVPGMSQKVSVRMPPALILRLVRTLCAFADIETQR